MSLPAHGAATRSQDLPGDVVPHLQAFKLLVLHPRGPEDRVDLAIVSMGVPIAWRTARSAMEKGWRSSENSDVDSPATHHSGTAALPMISQHLPLLSRAGLSKPTHTHTQTHTDADSKHTPPHHQAAIVAVLISGARPSGPGPAQSVGNAPSRLWRSAWVRTSDRDSDRPCWDSGGGRNPCQHALLRLPGLGSGTAIVRDSTPTSLLPAAQLPGHGSLDLTDLI